MNIHSIININLNSIPCFSENSSDYNKWTEMFDKKVDFTSDKLQIACVQGVYGYRCGILGKLLSYMSHNLNFNTHYIQNFLNSNCEFFKKNNLHSNDLLLFSSFFSIFNRFFPFFNFGNWDYKHYLVSDKYKYLNDNLSISNIFTLLNPILDSGCCILSNFKPIKSGYEPLEFYNKISLSDNYASKGIVWSLYNVNDENILICTFNLSDDLSTAIKLLELEQIMKVVMDIEKSLSFNVKTYIVGDFKCILNYNDLSRNFLYFNNDTQYIFYKPSDYIISFDNSEDNIFLVSFEQNTYGDIVLQEFKEEETKEEEIKIDIIEKKNDEEPHVELTEIVISPTIKENYIRDIISPSSSSSNEWTKI